MQIKRTKTDNLDIHEYNTEIVVTDGRTGKPKPIFSENRLGKWLLHRFRELSPGAVINGQIQPGLANHLAAYGLRIPGITGTWDLVGYSHNIITNVGHAATNGKLTAQGGYGTFTTLCLGVNTSTAAALDQALGQELTGSGLARNSGSAPTPTQTTTTVANDTSQLQKTWTASGSTFAITEEGIVDASTPPTVTTTTQSRINTDTSVTVTSGSGISNNDYLQWDNEIVQVTAGGGTGTLTITRGQKGTTAASHSSGVGLTDINTSGNMLAKQSFSAININGSNSDSIQVTHKVVT